MSKSTIKVNRPGATDVKVTCRHSPGEVLSVEHDDSDHSLIINVTDKNDMSRGFCVCIDPEAARQFVDAVGSMHGGRVVYDNED